MIQLAGQGHHRQISLKLSQLQHPEQILHDDEFSLPDGLLAPLPDLSEFLQKFPGLKGFLLRL